MTSFLDEFKAYVAEHGKPDRIELMLCDLNGVLRGKWLPGEGAAKLAKGGVRLPLSTYAPNIFGEEVPATGLGIVVGDPDGEIRPIPGSLQRVPWVGGNVAQVQVVMTDDSGEVSYLCPQARLQAVLDRFTARGAHPVVATELEFYLLQKRDSPEAPPVPPTGSPTAQNYDLDVLRRLEHVLKDITDACATQGLATDTLIAEYGPGQFEINFHHTQDVLAAAETALHFKRLVSEIADSHDYEATFMAKPYADYPGNGMHAHMSLVDGAGKNLFDAGTDAPSPLLKQAVAGVLATMRDLQAVFAPHMNSYRRFLPESFAPCAPDWGRDHRGAAVRIPEVSGPGARLEHRICGADVNPYLALAGILGGVLYGLENDPPLPLPLDDPNAKPAQRLTHDWRQAVERFAASEAAADIYTAAYRDVYVAVRRDEIARMMTEITPAEYRTYLSRL
ncbi:Gamma-glutamylputrescine synthetase PuuA [Pseudoruegeria aquimaris]|uniref:Gamma-glutamylputrescine synthetase PuuA n=1 Tax=Pseudoruegeria aquimaris TaxID=393663 RepID=A0A1Y5SD63_9RHOB|nr:glutamine synthetase family protein [Pseudoruegeria aquimaris]SLN37682.1 Gamma-glutamylputrescine synthetase PuuA [Pseudoruegeria aquimaris]